MFYRITLQIRLPEKARKVIFRPMLLWLLVFYIRFILCKRNHHYGRNTIAAQILRLSGICSLAYRLPTISCLPHIPRCHMIFLPPCVLYQTCPASNKRAADCSAARCLALAFMAIAYSGFSAGALKPMTALTNGLATVIDALTSAEGVTSTVIPVIASSVSPAST